MFLPITCLLGILRPLSFLYGLRNLEEGVVDCVKTQRMSRPGGTGEKDLTRGGWDVCTCVLSMVMVLEK